MNLQDFQDFGLSLVPRYEISGYFEILAEALSHVMNFQDFPRFRLKP